MDFVQPSSRPISSAIVLTSWTKSIIPVCMTSKLREDLISYIERKAAEAGLATSTWCRKACGDGKVYARLKSGGDITLGTIERIWRYGEGLDNGEA